VNANPPWQWKHSRRSEKNRSRPRIALSLIAVRSPPWVYRSNGASPLSIERSKLASARTVLAIVIGSVSSGNAAANMAT
jgi:hypothetical protein